MHTGGWRTVAYIQEHEFYCLSCLIFGSEMTVIKLCNWYKSLFNTSSHEHWRSCNPRLPGWVGIFAGVLVWSQSSGSLCLSCLLYFYEWLHVCPGPALVNTKQQRMCTLILLRYFDFFFFLPTRVTTSCNLPIGVFAHYENTEIQTETVSAPETYSTHMLSCSVWDMW